MRIKNAEVHQFVKENQTQIAFISGVVLTAVAAIVLDIKVDRAIRAKGFKMLRPLVDLETKEVLLQGIDGIRYSIENVMFPTVV